jgi:hypothetical protein
MSLAVPPGSKIGQFISHSYWAARLKDGFWLSEVDGDIWERHVLATGRSLDILELWLFGPKVAESDPQGNTACLVIERPGTAFQCRMESGQQCILRVNVSECSCSCFVWDGQTMRSYG